MRGRWHQMLQCGGMVAVVAMGVLSPLARDAQAAAAWTRVYTGLAAPIDIAHAGDGSQRLFVAEQSGRIRLIKGGVLQATPFLNLSTLTAANGEQGLLGFALHPQYASNGRFVVNYTRISDGATVIARYSVSAGNPDIADPASAVILLVMPQPFANHNGGAVKFGPDGLLYIAMGDGGSGNDPGNRAQDKSTLLGKMLRVDLNLTAPLVGAPYTIPAGNPWATGVGGLPEIFQLGLRNPWRFSFDRGSGDLWIGDVGQGAQEEIDRVAAGTGAGANFGWRVLEGTFCTGILPLGPVTCTDPTLTAPVITYGRSVGQSVTGGFVYRGTTVPSLAGRYVYADFVTGRIWAAQGSGSTWTPTELADTGFNVSTFGEDEAGELYFADYGSGDIYKFTETVPPVPVLQTSTAALAFGAVNVGASGVDQTVTVSNAGSGSLTLSALTLGGTDAGDFSRTGTCTATTSLAAAQTCTLVMRFTPVAAGSRSANLAIASNGGSATITLAGTGVAITPIPVLALAPTTLVFGSTTVGTVSVTQTATITNTGNGTLTLSALTIAGVSAAEFARTGTCTATTSLAATQSCTLIFSFSPAAAGSRNAALDIASNGGAATLNLTGTGVLVSGSAVLVASVASLDFGSVNVGTGSVLRTILLSSQGGATISITSLVVSGTNATEFLRGGSCAVGTTLAGVQTCSVTFIFVPGDAGARSASIAATSSGGGAVAVALAGTGATTARTLADVIEFYHAEFDHYFISAAAADIAALDSGKYKGWVRTQRKFKTLVTGQPGTSPVCRFYIPPAFGDSHFFSASPIECEEVRMKFPVFAYESAAVMFMFLPDATSGACPTGSIPIYRLWNTRADSNHRYTEDRVLRDAMVAKGYVSEGYGADAVAMCAPI